MNSCFICHQEIDESQGKQLTPRELAGKDVTSDSTDARALRSVATSMIVFDNPKGSADMPMYWLCNNCIDINFCEGSYKVNVVEMEMLKDMVTQNKKRSEEKVNKKWWEFWK